MPRAHFGLSYITIGVGVTEETLPDCTGQIIIFNNIAQERVMPRPHLNSSYTHPYHQRGDGYGGNTATRLYGA